MKWKTVVMWGSEIALCPLAGNPLNLMTLVDAQLESTGKHLQYLVGHVQTPKQACGMSG